MAAKMTYEQMVFKACDALCGGKFISRAQIKGFLTSNFGYVDSPMAKNSLKKALSKFEKKGDSFRISKAMKEQGSLKQKKLVQKAKLALKKQASKEKALQKKLALAAKKAAIKEKMAKKKEAVAAKKAAAKAKIASKKAAAKTKKAAKKAIKKPSKKVAKKKTLKKTKKVSKK